MPKPTTDDIDALLPQTQCELCGYAGCRPYATAITQGEAINKCLPGGVEVLKKLAALKKIDPEPYLKEMQQKQKPPMLAVIREAECIGCTKCIQACPVDAIIGARKLMHTVLTDICTGCELCIPPCPVDCIDMIPIKKRDDKVQAEFIQQSRQRYMQRNKRLTQQKKKQRDDYHIAKLGNNEMSLNARQAVIKAAVARVKKRRKNNHE